MFIYICVCMCIYMYVYIYIYMCIYISICMCIYDIKQCARLLASSTISSCFLALYLASLPSLSQGATGRELACPYIYIYVYINMYI